MDIIRKLAEELQIRPGQAQAAVKLIDEGNTIPFISRYRKEATGALNDEVLRNLYERLNYLRNLEEKKEQVISSSGAGRGRRLHFRGKRCGDGGGCTSGSHGHCSGGYRG